MSGDMATTKVSDASVKVEKGVVRWLRIGGLRAGLVLRRYCRGVFDEVVEVEALECPR